MTLIDPSHPATIAPASGCTPGRATRQGRNQQLKILLAPRHSCISRRSIISVHILCSHFDIMILKARGNWGRSI